jgi:phosphopantothenoylcysteine decarboxylase/phosphopantothenate--cysteine ligase
MILRGKSILLGVTGGIAAYKAVEVASRLVKAGAMVDVIMTAHAQEFVTPLTFQAITHRPVVTEMFALLAQTEIGHVALAQRADALVIAPATANCLAKLAGGIADDMLTTTALATEAPLVLAPAMESHMWGNPITQSNVARLQELRDVTLVGPACGRLASGAVGLGRMSEPREIVDTIRWVLGREGPLRGKHAIVTAGGTREPLDPIRYLGNRSSGRMGYALAEALRDRGAQVTLIGASTNLPQPVGVEFIAVETAEEMLQAVLRSLSDAADILVMAAAVADYRPAEVAEQKIKKGEQGLTLELARTVDILQEVGRSPAAEGLIKVGFAAETEDLIPNAQAKLASKKLDLIVANDPRKAMGSERDQVILLDSEGRVEELPELSKEEVAERIVDWVQRRMGDGKRSSSRRQ